MKKMFFLFLLAGSFLGCISYGYNDAFDFEGMPYGDYQESCAHCSYDPNTGWLKCSCQTPGSTKYDAKSSINISALELLYPAVRGAKNVFNDNGVLKVRINSNGHEYMFVEGGTPQRTK